MFQAMTKGYVTSFGRISVFFLKQKKNTTESIGNTENVSLPIDFLNHF